jgi:hypothetical protein
VPLVEVRALRRPCEGLARSAAIRKELRSVRFISTGLRAPSGARRHDWVKSTRLRATPDAQPFSGGWR